MPTPQEQSLIALIARWLSVLTAGTEIVEIRALDCSTSTYRKPHTQAGFFDRDHLNEAAAEAFRLSRYCNARGVYFTLNSINPALLARRSNRIGVVDFKDREIGTHDADITRRRWLLIDADPNRTAGVSSSADEKAAAERTLADVESYLFGEGWPDPIRADSGNGFHLLYRIDLPADDSGLVKQCLQALSAKFTSPAVTIDTSVFNPARICKLYGTASRKGDHVPDRPHRWAKILTPLPITPKVVPADLLEQLAAKAPADTLPQLDTAGINPKSRRRSKGKSSRPQLSSVERAAKYLAKVPPSISGQHGHDQLFHAAGVLMHGFALSISDAMPLLQTWNATCQPPWSDRDLARKLEEADKAPGERGKFLGEDPPPEPIRPPKSFDELTQHTGTTPGESQQIVNGIESITEHGTTVIPVPMPTIIEAIQKTSGGWPRRVGSALFVHESGTEVDWIEKPDSLLGWLGSKTGIPPRFVRSSGCHTKGEVFSELVRTCQSYKAVESLPHEPPIADHYYAYPQPEPGDGTALDGLINRFSPATPVDYDLIKALFATVIWGGDGGCRPAFVITARSGRGSGKSTLASLLGQFAGGVIEISSNEDSKTMKERLLSPEGLKKRVALLDNVKTLRFSWAELEAMITAKSISGRRMYVGEATRPNNLTWVVTLNGVSLSTDMAQRCVVIHLDRPEHSGDWEDSVRTYIEQYRHAIIADVVALLREEPIPLKTHSRWGKWEREVLSRLPDPSEAQKVILERQQVSNVEEEDTGIVEDFIRDRLEELTYSTAGDRIFIPIQLLAEWYNKAASERYSAGTVSRLLKQKIEEGACKRLMECGRSWGRGKIWVGSEFVDDGNSPVHTDIETRISEMKSRENRRGF